MDIGSTYLVAARRVYGLPDNARSYFNRVGYMGDSRKTAWPLTADSLHNCNGIDLFVPRLETGIRSGWKRSILG